MTCGCDPVVDAPFDKTGFCDSMHDFGQAYRHRGLELIKTCRRWSAASEQSFNQDAALSSVLQKCDKAIGHAVKSRKKTSIEADCEFEKAIRELKDYDSRFHPRETVRTTMDIAKEMDKREMYKSRNQARDSDLIVVDFHILRSLPPEENPTVAQQALSRGTTPPEIIWNFFHYPDERRLILAQNSHFYKHLPASPNEYGGTFTKEPAERCEGTIYVLTNNSYRVFLEFGERRRAFDNVWDMNDTLILRDVAGKLKGETVVEGYIQANPSFRYSTEFTAQSQTNAVAGTTNNWRNRIRALVKSKRTPSHIRICPGA